MGRAADQERQSIWSATADVIDVYTTSEALAAAARPNWNPHGFVRSTDTVYITAPAEHQASVAPWSSRSSRRSDAQYV